MVQKKKNIKVQDPLLASYKQKQKKRGGGRRGGEKGGESVGKRIGGKRDREAREAKDGVDLDVYV